MQTSHVCSVPNGIASYEDNMHTNWNYTYIGADYFCFRLYEFVYVCRFLSFFCPSVLLVRFASYFFCYIFICIVSVWTLCVIHTLKDSFVLPFSMPTHKKFSILFRLFYCYCHWNGWGVHIKHHLQRELFVINCVRPSRSLAFDSSFFISIDLHSLNSLFYQIGGCNIVLNDLTITLIITYVRSSYKLYFNSLFPTIMGNVSNVVFLFLVSCATE